MIVKHEIFNGIPALHVFNESMSDSAPITIFLHGFMSAKEHNLHYAYNLVEKGVRVILPEALLHGERAQNVNEVQMNLKFWEIVLTSIAEVGVLKQALDDRGLTGSIAIAGTSMGGITTTGCIKKYSWIKTAGILMGTVCYPKLLHAQFEQMRHAGIKIPLTEQEIKQVDALLAPFDAYADERLLTQIPIYMWHGERDAIVPVSMTKPYMEQLQEQDIAHQITYVMDKKAGHAVSRNGLLACTEFLAQNLA